MFVCARAATAASDRCILLISRVVAVNVLPVESWMPSAVQYRIELQRPLEVS